MSMQKNDPRLLQYVLNEISLSDRSIVELAMKSQPEIALEVAELQKIYGVVEAIESEPKSMSLSVERRQKLFEQTINKASPGSISTLFKKWRYAAGGLVAASFALMVFNHSLKDEAFKKSTDRMTIPADTQMAVAPERVADVHFENPPAGAIHTPETTGGELAKDLGQSAEVSAAQPPPSAPIEAALPPAPEPQLAAEEKEMMADPGSDKSDAPTMQNEISAPQKAIAARAKPIDEQPLKKKSVSNLNNFSVTNNDARDAKGLLGAFGGGRKQLEAEGSAPVANSKAAGAVTDFQDDQLQKAVLENETQKIETRAATKTAVAPTFQLLISSRGLEVEEIKNLQDVLKACLQKYKGFSAIRITYNSETKDIEQSPKPQKNEERFYGACVQHLLGVYLPKRIKSVQVDLIIVPNQDK